jgi:hypothetical protein
MSADDYNAAASWSSRRISDLAEVKSELRSGCQREGLYYSVPLPAFTRARGGVGGAPSRPRATERLIARAWDHAAEGPTAIAREASVAMPLAREVSRFR